MTNFFDDFYENAAKDYEYQALLIGAKIAKSIENTMIRQGISNKDLAENLKCKPSYVTKLLRGEQNLSLKSLAKISLALNYEVKVSFVHKAPVSLECFNDWTQRAAASNKLKPYKNFYQELEDSYSSNDKGKKYASLVAA